MAINPRRRKSEATEGLPEGPYEAGASQIQLASNAAMLETIEFIAALRGKGSDSLSIDPRDLGIVLHLMRNHVSGRLTTYPARQPVRARSRFSGLWQDGLSASAHWTDRSTDLPVWGLRPGHPRQHCGGTGRPGLGGADGNVEPDDLARRAHDYIRSLLA